jgi:hypothetical protein
MIEVTKQTNEQLAKSLVEMKKIIEELTSQFDEAKTELKKRNIKNTFYYPEFDSKVYMTEGRESSEYDVMEVYSDMIKEHIMEEFPKIVKINKSQVDSIEDIYRKNLINSILLKNATIKISEPSITVGKMTLKEKKEFENKEKK